MKSCMLRQVRILACFSPPFSKRAGGISFGKTHTNCLANPPTPLFQRGNPKLTIPFLILLLELSISITTSAGEKLNTSGNAEVTADTLQVDHKNRTAQFQGNVHAVFDTLKVTCKTMSLTYNDAGDVQSLKALGNVTVIRQDIRATAHSVYLNSRTGRLVLKGSPSVVKGTHRLTGKVIEIDLASGRLEVKEARGTFRLKKEKK